MPKTKMNSIIHIAILPLVLSWYLSDANAQFRVFNGNDISIEQSRHSIAIFYEGGYNFVGSLVSLKSVVTVAHSVINREPSLFLLLAGVADLCKMDSEKAQKRSAESAHPHPDYNREAAYADIAVIKVAELFSETDQVKPISLCESQSIEGTPLKISGWGSVIQHKSGYYNLLQSVELFISNLEKCKRVYRLFKPEYVLDTLICAICVGENPYHGDSEGGAFAICAGKKPCHGDSGAGAIAEGKLCAVVQGGIGSTDFPSLYTDVTNPIVNAFLRDHLCSN